MCQRALPPRRPGPSRRGAAGRLAATLALLAAPALSGEVAAPQRLADTGLYVDVASLEVDPRHLPFAPQYPLWTDGAEKRRWISLPPGAPIDGSDADAWVFPVGTRLWKEFSFGGRRVETRYMERVKGGGWLFAAYEWSEDGREATLAPEQGRRNAHPLGEGRAHTIPGTADCRVCHGGGESTVIGFSALQLSPLRDPAAVHAETPPEGAVDLDDLIAQGLIAAYPEALRAAIPEISAADAEERAALGYLHGNCGHCHNETGPLANLGLRLDHTSDAVREPAAESTVGRRLAKPIRALGEDVVLRVAPGDPQRSALLGRMASRNPVLQMPPLGTELVDREAVALLERWIAKVELEGGTAPATH